MTKKDLYILYIIIIITMALSSILVFLFLTEHSDINRIFCERDWDYIISHPLPFIIISLICLIIIASTFRTEKKGIFKYTFQIAIIIFITSYFQLESTLDIMSNDSDYKNWAVFLKNLLQAVLITAVAVGTFNYENIMKLYNDFHESKKQTGNNQAQSSEQTQTQSTVRTETK